MSDNDLDSYHRNLSNGHVNYFYKDALITRIYDADTIEVEKNVGFGWKDTEPTKFRLYGINAPELRGADKAEGKLSRDWLRQKICTENTEFDRWGYITNDVKNFIDFNSIKVPKTVAQKGKYGRYLVILWDSNGSNINWEMVDNGIASIANY